MQAQKVYDFHTHAYQAPVAKIIMRHLEVGKRLETAREFFHLHPDHKAPTIEHLIAVSQANGIDRTNLLLVGVKPGMLRELNEWGLKQREAHDNLSVLGAVHPNINEEALNNEIKWLRDHNFPGVKIQSVHQRMEALSQEAKSLYKKLADAGLFVLMDTGNYLKPGEDGYKYLTRPAMVAEITKEFPDLRIIAAHLGGFMGWDESENYLVDKDFDNLWLDTAFMGSIVKYYKSQGQDRAEQVKRILLRHRPDRLLFGTDIPYNNPTIELAFIRTLLADFPDLLQQIMWQNAADLLGYN